MPLCSAVVVVAPAAQPALRAALGADPAFTLGPAHGARMALVVEGRSTDELTAQLRSLGEHEGVEGVFPVYHAFEDEEPASSYGRRGGRA